MATELAMRCRVVTRNSQWIKLGELRDFAGVDGDIVYITGVKGDHINLSVGHRPQARRKEFLGRCNLGINVVIVVHHSQVPDSLLTGRLHLGRFFLGDSQSAVFAQHCYAQHSNCGGHDDQSLEPGHISMSFVTIWELARDHNSTRKPAQSSHWQADLRLRSGLR